MTLLKSVEKLPLLSVGLGLSLVYMMGVGSACGIDIYTGRIIQNLIFANC